MAKIVKVRILGETIPVNIADWRLTFGNTGETPKEVREEVLDYIKNVIQQLQVWDEVTDGYAR